MRLGSVMTEYTGSYHVDIVGSGTGACIELAGDVEFTWQEANELVGLIQKGIAQIKPKNAFEELGLTPGDKFRYKNSLGAFDQYVVIGPESDPKAVRPQNGQTWVPADFPTDYFEKVSA